MRRMAVYFTLVLWPLFALSNTFAPIGKGQYAELPFGKTLDGDVVSINEHKNKVMVALYYTSWCGYCRKAMPHFRQFQEVAAKAGLQVVFINHKEDRKLFRDHVRWAKETSLVMAHDKSGQFGDAYHVESYPHIIVTDHNGKIVAVDKGWGDDSANYYAKLLGQLLEKKQRADNPAVEQAVAPPAEKKNHGDGVEINREVALPKPNWSEISLPEPSN